MSCVLQIDRVFARTRLFEAKGIAEVANERDANQMRIPTLRDKLVRAIVRVVEASTPTSSLFLEARYEKSTWRERESRR